MSLELTAFAGTIASGAFALAILLYLLSGKTFADAVSWLARHEKAWTPLLVFFLVAAFIVGILAERGSDRLEETGYWFVPLAKDDDIRKTVFEGSFRKEYAEFRKRVVPGKPGERPSIDAPKTAYHEARPAVLEIETFANELNGIQTNLRFTRSLTISSALLGLLALIGCVATWRTSARRRELAILVAVLVAVCVLSSLSYGYLEEEYDKRVYAYHLHLLKKSAAPK